jgi:hypothetical protein
MVVVGIIRGWAGMVVRDQAWGIIQLVVGAVVIIKPGVSGEGICCQVLLALLVLDVEWQVLL